MFKAWNENEVKKKFDESTQRWNAKEDSFTLQEKDNNVSSTSITCTLLDTGDYCTMHGFLTDVDNGCTLQENTDDMASTSIACTMSDTSDSCTVHGFLTNVDKACPLQENKDDVSSTSMMKLSLVPFLLCKRMKNKRCCKMLRTPLM